MTTMTADKFGQSGPSASYAFAYNKVIHAEGTPEQAHQAGLKAHLESVWGPGYKLDRAGKPIPTGVGAPGHETGNHFASIRRYEGEQKYQVAIREMWKQNPERAKLIGLEQPERLGQ
jgi:hypothetical protein